MATAEFHERKVLYETAVQAGRQVIEHPDFDFSAHPYAETFAGTLVNATFGVLDVTNGIIHAMDTMKADSIGIVPLTQADVKKIKPTTKFTFADDFLKQEGTGPVYDFSHLKSQTAECRLDDSLVVPVIFLHPDLGLRTPLQLGSTVVHEMDHGYWDRHQAEVWPHGCMETLHGDVAMEVSAYSLEEKVFSANAPHLYAEAMRMVRAKYANYDYTGQEVRHKKGANHLARNMRSVAFLSMMFRHYGIKPGDNPSEELIAAMRAQKLINTGRDVVVPVQEAIVPVDAVLEVPSN